MSRSSIRAATLEIHGVPMVKVAALDYPLNYSMIDVCHRLWSKLNYACEGNSGLSSSPWCGRTAEMRAGGELSTNVTYNRVLVSRQQSHLVDLYK